MRTKFHLFILLILLITTSVCVEPYDFQIENNEPTLVVEGQVSSLSYNDCHEVPSDGRYFTVRLGYTNDVSNKRDMVAGGATVVLHTSQGDDYLYIESDQQPGIYFLYDKDFKALAGIKYQLDITLADGDQYKSDWQQLPGQPPPVSDAKVYFKEITEKAFEVVAGEKEIQEFDAIELYLPLPKVETSDPVFYRWDFDPTWIYVAPFGSSARNTRTCYVSNKNYLPDFILQKDIAGGYPQKLTSLRTTNNEKVYKELCLLITQTGMNEDYYQFWKELQEQQASGGLFDTPLYNLQTNVQSVNTSKKVTGYFSVVHEKAFRWYFNINDLSYHVSDRTQELCSISYGPDGPGGPECYDCRDSKSGDATNIQPWWWKSR